MFVGLVIGGGSCFLLVPVIFWPGRRGRRSLYDRLGEPGWIVWAFAVLLLGIMLYWMLTTRATVRRSDGFMLRDHFLQL
jgi:hypothetical protein